MKHVSEIAMIAAVSFAGELLNYLLPLPIPGSIYGLVLMLVLLITGIFKVEKVKTVSDWLITFMPIMFVGPVVGLMNSYGSYKSILIPIFVISTLTTIITMAATGRAAQGIMRLQNRKEGKNHAE